MPLSHIEHFLLQTTDMAKTRDWYVRVLGLRVGPNPDFKFFPDFPFEAGAQALTAEPFAARELPQAAQVGTLPAAGD